MLALVLVVGILYSYYKYTKKREVKVLDLMPFAMSWSLIVVLYLIFLVQNKKVITFYE